MTRSVFFCLTICVSLLANGAEDDGPYCGIYAVYGAVSASGVNAEFSDLLDTRFVSSHEGSTAEDLVEAAGHFGLQGRVFRARGLATLYMTRVPLILHVSKVGQYQSHSHWMLFLGITPEGALVASSDGEISGRPVAEILARWDGSGVAVEAPGGWAMSYWAEYLCFAAVIIGALFVSVRLHRCFSKRFTWSWFPLTLLALCVLQLGTYSFAPGTKEWAQVLARSYKSFSPNLVSFNQLRSLSKGVVLVDARRRSDFEKGSIPGAVNIPFDSGEQTISKFLAQSHSGVVVFCQSEKCIYDKVLAQRLYNMGCDNVKVFAPGFSGWTQLVLEAMQEHAGDWQSE